MDLVEPDEPIVVILLPAQWREVFGAMNRAFIENPSPDTQAAWRALWGQLEGKISPA